MSTSSSALAPFASFEARCAKLPYLPPAVVLLPINVVDVDSRSQAELTAMFERAMPNHQTMGLTQARIGHNATINVKGLQQESRGHACVRAHVRIELFMQPITVFVASELARNACRRAAVHEHEMKHVEVYETYLREAAADLARSLPDIVGDRVYYAANLAEAQGELAQTLSHFLDAFQEKSASELGARQALVDSASEYARVANACGAVK